MVVLDKYQDELREPSANDHTDAPPSYETITTAHSGQPNSGPSRLVNEKSPRQSAFPTTPRNSSSFPSDAGLGTSRPANRVSQSNPSWLSMLSFTSSRTSKQVRQTVLSLIRDLVLNVESPDLFNSCADACRTYGLDLSAILQEPYIEHHSAVYWGILNRRDTLLPSLLAYAAPLLQSTISDVRLACLATSNQALFQSLRCQREPFTKQMAPLSTSSGRRPRIHDILVVDTAKARMRSCSAPCRRTKYQYTRWTTKGLSWQRCRLTSGKNACGFLVASVSSLLHEVGRPTSSHL